MVTIFLQSEIEKASKLGFTEGAKSLPAPDATDPDLNESKFYAKAVSVFNITVQKSTSWWLPGLYEHLNILELQQH